MIVVIALALITALIWWRVDPSQAVNHVVALLIVACPCALALATPLAIAVAIGRLAKREVLVRSGDCLERLSRPGTVFFDKTGTLTEGRMQVSQWFGSDEVLRDVALIEATVNHPIARAIVEYCRSPDRARRSTQSHTPKRTRRAGSGTRCSRPESMDAVYTIGSPRLLEEERGERSMTNAATNCSR